MSDVARTALSTITCWCLAALFLCISVYDFKRESPAQFYPWIKIEPKMVENVRAYNIENGTMWLSCSFVFVIVGIVSLLNSSIMAALYLLCLFPGSIFLVKRYKKILKTYLVEEYTRTTSDPQ